MLNRQVSIEEGDNKARDFGVIFIETSAKAGFNIKVHFEPLITWFASLYYDVSDVLWINVIYTNNYRSLSNVMKWLLNIQPLFRKIASALPGMETLSSTRQEDMVDVNLKPHSSASQSEQQGGGCSC